MTLKCQCGGPVVVEEGSDPDAGPQHWELYRCEECGLTGTYHFGPNREDLTGCLVATQPEVYAGP
jgi:hypothetical protein